MEEQKNQTDPLLELFFEASAKRKGERVVALDLRGSSSVADYFLVMSGRSNRQVSAIAQAIEDFLRDRKIRPLGVEGMKEGQWVLMDYGDVVVHIFHDPVRSFYDIEGLWADAKRIQPPGQGMESPEGQGEKDGE